MFADRRKTILFSNNNKPKNLFDVDALAFFNAVVNAGGSLTNLEKNVTNQLFLDLKNNSLYTKINAFYPLVGGSANSCKFNMKFPNDNNASHRLTFFGGWLYNSTGITPNGTTAYANTYLNPLVHLTQNSVSIGVYCKNMAGAIDRAAIGVNNGVSYIQLYPRGAGNVFYGDLNDNGSTSTANSYTATLLAVSRINSTQKIHSIGGVNTIKTNSSNGVINNTIFLGARSTSGTANSFFNTEIKTCYISSGLTTTELTLLNSIITTFNTSLGRP
jgi:hypothetical protein